MFKKIPWKTILLTLFVWTAFWDIKETINGDKDFFLFRWIYSDINYARNIEVLSYILTDEQVCYLVCHPEEEINQLNQKELFLKEVNLVLRIRNLYSGFVKGRLSWSRPGEEWNTVDVKDIPIPGNSKKFGDIIIALGVRIVGKDDMPPDPVSIRWDELYVYR